MGIVNSGANPKRIAGHTHFPHAASPECSASPKKADEGSRGGGGGGGDSDKGQKCYFKR